MLFGIKETEEFLRFKQTYAAGTVLFEENDMSRETYILIKGVVEVIKQGRHIATITTPASFIGEMSTLLSEPRSATIRIREKSNFIVLNEKNFSEMLQKFPIIGIKLAQSLAARLSMTTKELVKHVPDLQKREKKFSMIELEANIPLEERIDILDNVVLEHIFSRTRMGYDFFKQELNLFCETKNSKEVTKLAERYGVFDLYKDALVEHYKKVLAIEKLTLTTERIKIDIPATFSVVGDKRSFVGKVKNISEGGFFLETKAEIEKSSVLKVKLFFPKEKKFLEIEGTAAWIRSENAEGEFGIGIQFVNLPPKKRAIIERNMLYFVERDD